MSSINLTKQDQVYEDTKKALMKYCNENTSSMCQEGGVVMSEGTFWNDWGGGRKSRGNFYRGKNAKRRGQMRSAKEANFDIGSYHPKVQRDNMNLEGKKVNKKIDGRVMTCDYCGAYTHLQANCWEKQKMGKNKTYATAETEEDEEDEWEDDWDEDEKEEHEEEEDDEPSEAFIA